MNRLLIAISLLSMLSVLFISLLVSPILAQSWSNGAAMPTVRSEITAAIIGDDIYVIGELDRSGDVLNIVEVYNVKNDSWKSVTPIPQPLHHTAAASYNGKIYVVGGFISREWIPTNQLFIYDPIKDEWEKGNSMPTARGALNAIFLNGSLYAVGGQGTSKILNTNEAYNPLTDRWITKAPMLTERHHAASTSVNDRIYVVGGRTAGSSPLVNVNVNEMYDTKADTWRALEPMPSKRSGIAAASGNNSFFVFGGEDLSRTYDNNEKYNTVEGKWISEEPMPTSRHGLAAVSVDDRIFVIGGGPEPGLSTSDTNEIFIMK